MANQLRIDPTRTTTLVRQYVAEYKRRMNALKKAIVEAVVKEDALGLIPGSLLKLNVAYQEWRFQQDPDKVDSFNNWLQQEVDTNVLQVQTAEGIAQGPLAGQPWNAKYVDSAYKKGKTRAYVDANQAKLLGSPDFYQGTKAEFLRQSFGAPETLSKLKLIYSRNYSELQGVTASMSQQISRALVNGLAAGQNPEVIAKAMTESIDGMTRKRANMIARTEVVHAHAEGQLDSFEELGIEEVGIMAEWSTAGDDLVCPLCLPLEGNIMTIKEARGIIPRHPYCRCMWIPANVGEKHGGQAWNDQFIKKKINKSIAAEKPGKSLEVAKMQSPWLGKTKKITSKTQLKTPTVGGKPVNKPLVPGEPSTIVPAPGQTGPVIPSTVPKPPTPAVTAPKPKIAPKRRTRVSIPPPESELSVTGIARDVQLPFVGDVEILPTQLGGSTGAKLVKVTSGGRSKTYVMKAYNGNQLQVQNEYIANRAYNTLKSGTAGKSYIAKYQGKEVLFSEYIDDLNGDALRVAVDVGGDALKDVQKKMADMFVTDSWLANWDVNGLRFDNVGLKGNKWIRIDNGGSLLFRAQGGLKGSNFGSTVGELTSMRKSAKNVQAKKIFGKITDKQLIKHIDKFETRVNNAGGIDYFIKDMTRNVNMSNTQQYELNSTLRARYSDILKQRDALKLSTAPQKKIIYDASHVAKKATYTTDNYDELYTASRAARDAMTEGQKRAVRSFTGHKYGDINRAVMGDRVTLTSKNLDKALDRSPGYTRIAGRGQKNLKPEEWDNWTSGKWAQVEWKGYSSSSVSPSSVFPQGHNGVMYIIKNKGRQGRYVEAASSHSSEKELLFKRGAKFRVTGYAQQTVQEAAGGARKRYLLIEEFDDHAKIPTTQVPPKEYTKTEMLRLFRDSAKDGGVN